MTDEVSDFACVTSFTVTTVKPSMRSGIATVGMTNIDTRVRRSRSVSRSSFV